MCGFFAFAAGISAREFADLFDFSNLPKSMAEIESVRYYPTSWIPTISRNSPNQLLMRHWSLIPRWWSKQPNKLPFSSFNARIEQIATKPVFRDAWLAGQRCLIPATWFYEYQTDNSGTKPTKKPFQVKVVDQPIFALAGLYETWQGLGGEAIDSVTILTRTANNQLESIHGREPVVVAKKYWNCWLDRRTPLSTIDPLLTQSVDWEISSILN